MLRSLGIRARAVSLHRLTTGAPILAALLASACVPDPQPLWPALTGEPNAAPYVPTAAATDWPATLRLNAGEFQLARLSTMPPGEEDIDEDLREIRGDLDDIRRSTTGSDRRLQQFRNTASERSEAYVDLAERIDADLRFTAQPADPVLERRWRQALSALDRLASDDPALVRLIGRIAADREAAEEAVEALNTDIDLAEATSEQRAARDDLLRDAESAVAALAAMQAEAEQDLMSLRAYVAAERANLQILRLAIANGEAYGISLANRAVADIGARRDRPPEARRGDSPLVVIRFDADEISYAQPLYRAASLALERRADALFTVVAVAPDSGLDEARDRASEVSLTLSEMGLPEGQLTETNWSDPEAVGAEVHLYVR